MNNNNLVNHQQNQTKQSKMYNLIIIIMLLIYKFNNHFVYTTSSSTSDIVEILSSKSSSSTSTSKNFQHSSNIYRLINNNQCPKTLNCTDGYFDEGKDCYESNRNHCNCIAHCCLAFDCRDWGHLVQCRRKCGSQKPNRFGLKLSEKLECEKYLCDPYYFDPSWDARNSNNQQRNCIGHCCYAFDCRRALGYCRHECGVETWVTARPLGR